MIFFNWLGIGMGLVGVAVTWTASRLIGNIFLAILMGEVGTILLDIWYRWHKEGDPTTIYNGEPILKWFYPRRGGSVMFLPVWLIGGYLLVATVFGLPPFY